MAILTAMGDPLYTIGLLSGTSADATDGVLVKWLDEQPQVIAKCNLPIPNTLRDSVIGLANNLPNEIEQIRSLDLAFAKLFSQTAMQLCQDSGIPHQNITAIGCHGQTIRHYPPPQDESTLGFSLQIGDANIIAETCGITTVADMRRRDIAVGGHGAPLAPGLHAALFRSPTKDRVILNTGGIANITMLSPNRDVLGFDTGPANGLMDAWCLRHTNRSYDDSGLWASQGHTDADLLQHLLAHPFFKQTPPKSTGREDFNLQWLDEVLNQLGKTLEPVDVQATLMSLSVETISQAIENLDLAHFVEVYICGGGAHNTAFCEQLKLRLNSGYLSATLSSTSALGIEPDWVEAVCFAWIAKRTMEGKTSNLPSVTGAKKAVVLGGIYYS